MKLVRGLLGVSLLALSLSACTFMEQHAPSGLVSKSDQKYLGAKSTHGLQIPAGLSSSKVGTMYRIPPVTGTGPVPASTIPPGGISSQLPPGYVKPVPANSNFFLKPIVKQK